MAMWERLRQSATFAVRGLNANRLRSALTTLGILIGVASVIILLAVGTGSSVAVSQSIEKLGSNTLTVNKSSGGTGGGAGGFSFANLFGGGGDDSASADLGTKTRNATLTVADAKALLDKTTAPHIAAAAPVVQPQSVVATFGGKTHTINQFSGTTPQYFAISNDTIAAGAFFTDSDYLQRQNVTVLGSTAAKDLFGGDGLSAVSKTVAYNGVKFRVVGVLTAKGSTGPIDSDDVAVAPLTSTQDRLSGPGDINSISVQAPSADDLDSAQAEINNILDGRHGVTARDRDYSIFNQATIVSALTSSNDTFTVLLGAVAAISLLVGGIGVMNIMLVTVTERTREIGIRKAIGAGKSDILGQFLIEAVLLSLFGAVMGVVIGLVGSNFTIVGVEPVVRAYSVALAFGVALLTGLFFGIYPANRAASLRPIDALRYE